jgi:hypothetical protein
VRVWQLRELLQQRGGHFIVTVNGKEQQVVLETKQLPSGHETLNIRTLEDEELAEELATLRARLDVLLELKKHRNVVLPGEEE